MLHDARGGTAGSFAANIIQNHSKRKYKFASPHIGIELRELVYHNVLEEAIGLGIHIL